MVISIQENNKNIIDRFIFEGYEEELMLEFANLLRRYEYEPNEDKVEALVEILEEIYENNRYDEIDPEFYMNKKTEIINPCPPEMLCMLISKTRYFINIKRTAIALLALLVDLFATKGITTVVLTLLGQINRAVYRLSDDELTLLLKISRLSKEKECVTLKELYSHLKGRFSYRR